MGVTMLWSMPCFAADMLDVSSHETDSVMIIMVSSASRLLVPRAAISAFAYT